MVQAALTLPVFFFLLFGFLDAVLLTYNWAILQFSLDRITRDSVVQVARSPQEIEQRIIARTEELGLNVDLRPEDILVCGGTANVCSDGAMESRGAAGDFFAVRIRHRLNLSFFPGAWTVQNTVFVLNEPR